MSKALYAVINPIVKLILRSPLHGLMSRNTLLLEFKGRKSGRIYTTPVSYRATNGHVHCFTEKANAWWHNLRDGNDVEITLQGQRVTGRPTLLADGSAEVQAALRDLLVASPRDAAHAGVRLDADGQPVASDLANASQGVVFIAIELHAGAP